MDLRERAISAAQAGDLTPEEVAERFGVGAARLYAWLRRKREAGTTEPRPEGRRSTTEPGFEPRNDVARRQTGSRPAYLQDWSLCPKRTGLLRKPSLHL